ncbi:hypothetical protein J416_11322 [Gracilibacillus halophilus YIM-C55.5]|uniref:Sin domain-containing protein n=1 Tax=Gracilibacillus halophilus YIM-C55.5 TaxID=1308866 RepID=N4WJL0_9BACI|nr:anti-repressor SinI family protein [Gracilibacillus halophilus]ENH96352.1 hypothetical protein J416_11322 [Gracilibacillus halophilus YIM-C55.5]
MGEQKGGVEPMDEYKHTSDSSVTSTIDTDWLKLVYLAKFYGLSKEEVRAFLTSYPKLKDQRFN